jgi:hypothetical protein
LSRTFVPQLLQAITKFIKAKVAPSDITIPPEVVYVFPRIEGPATALLGVGFLSVIYNIVGAAALFVDKFVIPINTEVRQKPAAVAHVKPVLPRESPKPKIPSSQRLEKEATVIVILVLLGLILASGFAA